MDESHRKANETRRKNEDARRAVWEAKRAAIDAARVGLQRVLENPDTAPADVVHAAELIIKLVKD